MMNPDIKKEWVAALRSGEYQQAHGYLHTSQGFCCLGVLCDLHRKATNGPEWAAEGEGTDEDPEPYRYMKDWGVLPEEVAKWAGLPLFNHDISVRMEGFGDKALSELNDKGCNFNQIADAIEEQL